MGVLFRSAGTTVAGNNTTSLAPGLPPGWQPGDLLLCFASTRLRTATASLATWTSITSYQHTGAGGRMYVFGLIATSGTTAPTVTFASGGTNNTVQATIIALRNTRRNSTPWAVGTWSENASAQNIGPITALAPTKNDGMILVVGHKSDDATSIANPSGDGCTWGEALFNTSALGSDATQIVKYGYWSGSPPTITNKTLTVTGGAANLAIGVMLEILPAIIETDGSLTQAQAATLSGTGALDHAAGDGDAALTAQAATGAGTGTTAKVGTGSLSAQAATSAGTGTKDSPLPIYSVGSTVELLAQAGVSAGTGEIAHPGTGSLAAQAATASGAGTVTQEAVHTGTGAIVSEAATTSGFGSTSQPATIYELGSPVGLVAQAGAASGTGSAGASYQTHTGTGALAAGAASAVGGTLKNVWDVGSNISLIAGSAATQVSSGIVVEDVGATAELVAQSALLLGSSTSSKTAVGALVGQSAILLGSGAPTRKAIGDLIAASAQAYGVSERLIIGGSASLVAGNGQLAASTVKNNVALAPLAASEAVIAATGGLVRTAAGSLSASAADVDGVAGHSTALGPVGAGELIGGLASITNSSVVNKTASGTLHADDAIIAASGKRSIVSVDAALEGYPASVTVSSLAGDILTWEDDDAIWGQPAVIHARDYPVFPQGNIFYQADFGTNFDKEPVRVLLERTGLALLGRDRQGNWKINQGVIKFVSGVWPFMKGTPGAEVLVYVGSQNHPEEAITWEGPYTAIIGETEFIDFTVSGRYIAIRFESIGQPPWELISYDLDLTTVGER
jgi:hypothetical protein